MLTRRLFLRGTSAIALALPALELTHSTAWAQSSPFAKRFVTVFSHGGIINTRQRGEGAYEPKGAWFGYDLWRPPTEGAELTTLGEEMANLASIKSDLLLLRGVWNRAGRVQGLYGGGGHRTANVTALTQAQVERTTDSQGDEVVRPLGPSIDHVIAQRLQARTSSPRLRVDFRIQGQNYGTPFYSGPRSGIVGETNPVTAFNDLFSTFTPTGTPVSPELTRLRAERRSVLDGVKDGLTRFKRGLGTADRQKIDAHFEHVRTIELRLQDFEVAATCDPSSVTPMTGNGGVTGPLMVDIALHALRCGLSNVATINIDDIITPWVAAPLSSRGEISYNIGHSLGHFIRYVGPGGTKDSPQNRADFLTEIKANRQWRLSLFKRVVEGLKQTPEGAGTMLDNSIVYFTSEFSCPEQHSCNEPPVLIAGRAGGRFRTGRYINYNTGSDPLGRIESTTSLHNVYTAFLRAVGENDEHFGNNDQLFRGPIDLS